jgi:hypothetical protein
MQEAAHGYSPEMMKFEAEQAPVDVVFNGTRHLQRDGSGNRQLQAVPFSRWMVTEFVLLLLLGLIRSAHTLIACNRLEFSTRATSQNNTNYDFLLFLTTLRPPPLPKLPRTCHKPAHETASIVPFGPAPFSGLRA